MRARNLPRSRSGRRLVAGLGALVTFVALGAAPSPANAAPAPRASNLSGSIMVSAAASLTESFTELGRAFHAAHPKATVEFNFGSSSTLAAQINAGAPADVFASADLTTMDKLVGAGTVEASPSILARNTMSIAVKPGNPGNVVSVTDLARVRTLALCAATAPCGIYAKAVLDRAKVNVPEGQVTRAADATSTLNAVSRGDADAAIVYTTDVRGAGTSVTAVAIPADQNVVAVYPIAPLAGSQSPKVARAFVTFATSRKGRSVLARHGFLAP